MISSKTLIGLQAADLSLAKKLLYVVMLTVSLGVLAQVKVFLPWTPVPLVATQLGIIAGVLILGKNWGVMPVLTYIAGGVIGIPWFAGYGAGLGYLTGPTGGYLVGFVLSALFLARVIGEKKHSLLTLTAIIGFSQLVLIYLPGLLQLYFWNLALGNSQISLNGLLSMGFYPFVVGDLIKIFIGTLLAKTVIK